MKKLLKLALIIGVITAVAKLVAAKKAEWQGLTEAQIREKLDARLPGQMPAEKRAAVADKVVAKMRLRGVLEEAAGPDLAEKADESVVDSAGDNTESE